MLTVAYVGTLGRHIEHGVRPDLGQCVALPVACRLRAGWRGLASTSSMAKTIYGTLIGAIDNQTISPNYTNSSGGPVVAFAQATYLQNSGNSNYNSLQISAERRARDLTYLLSYTYAKSLDNYCCPLGPSRSEPCLWPLVVRHAA